MRSLIAMAGLFVAALAPVTGVAQQQWVEGKHYFLVKPAQRTNVAPGKIEVAEAFSFGCPACYSFNPLAKQLQGSLPSNAQFVYNHASFNPSESWPLFQRAFLTATALGIEKKTHDAMFEAIWKTGELAVVDSQTRRLKNPQPNMEQVAKFYEKATGGSVKAADFLNASKSMGVQVAINRTEAWLRATQVDSTPTLVVNGKYRLTVQSAGGVEQMFSLVNYLVGKEGGAAATR
jgi:protein dithiol oxidoreductase (disulfide-forming)